ncbi:unnamed protein product [Brassica rapa subsp. trilocularis]
MMKVEVAGGSGSSINSCEKMMLETIYMESMNRSINLCIQCFSFLICVSFFYI